MTASRDSATLSDLKEVNRHTDETPTDSKDKNSMEHKTPILTGADIALVLKDYEYNGGKPKSWYSWSSEMNQLYKFHKSLANKNGPLLFSELAKLDKLLQKKVKAKTAIAFEKLKEKRPKNIIIDQSTIFHTPTVSEKEYPFIKPVKHFKLVKKKPTTNLSQTHIIEIMKKKPKNNIKRDNKNWVRVKETPDERLRQLAISSAEMGNFAYGGPKYRMNDFRLISEEITDMVSSHNYFHRDGGKNQYLPPENMARVMAHKWIYEEDDFNIHNSYVANGLFGSIDPEYMLGSLTLPFSKLAHNPYKVVHYNIRSNLHGRVEKPFHDDEINYLTDKPVNYMGQIAAEDYRTFPHIKYRTPTNWFTSHYNLLTIAANQNKNFRNEFNLQILKELVTKNILVEFPRIHIEKKSSVLAKNIIDKNLADLLNIVKEEKEFQQFLTEKGSFAIKIILFEVRDFLIRNKHYRRLGMDGDHLQWSKMCKTIFDELFSVLKLAKISVDGLKEELEDFSKELYRNSFDAIKSVKASYKDLGSNIRAAQIQLPEDMKSESNSNSMFEYKLNKKQ